jgi:hypothetical protein
LGSYTCEDIKKIISQTKAHAELMIFYIDYIRNYKELTEGMLENIKNFDDNSKMILIIEYNTVIKALKNLL